ncbi:MAG: hypothetical protein ACKO0W_02480 [Planctomycetota bacterium]
MTTGEASQGGRGAQQGAEGGGNVLGFIPRGVLTSGATLAGIALAAIAFSFVVGFWTSTRGVIGPLASDAERPALAAITTIFAFAISTAIACAVARVVNSVVGLFVLGCGVGLLAMRGSTSADLVFGGSSLLAGAIELVVWTALVAGASHAIFRIGGRLPDIPKTHEDDIDSPTGPAARKSWIAGVAALLAAWIVAASVTKGQAIGAAVVGGFAAGAFGRFLAPRTTPVYLAAAPVAAFAALWFYFAFALKGDFPTGWVEGALPRLLLLMPVDIAAGALAGVSLGFGFARGFAPATDE